MKLILTGQVPAKKNSRITTRSGASFPNKKFTDWEKDVFQQLDMLRLKPIDGTVNIFCKFYCKDLVGRDTDNMLASVLDVLKDQKKKIGGKMMLVRKGVFTDDSWLTAKPIIIDAALDRAHPRVEIWINEPITDVLENLSW